MAAALQRARAGGGAPRKGGASLWLLAALALGPWTQMASCSIEDVLIMDVPPPTELIVKAGTDARLPCTFISSEEISTATSVTWSFQREASTARPMTFFYYSDGKEYSGKNTQFNGRSRWDGNFTMSDASIIVENVQPTDNGTYFCDVKNPPDIVAEPGQVKVNVLEPESPIGHGRSATAIPEIDTASDTAITKTTTSGSISLNGASFWPLVLTFSCILSSFPNYLF
ncbi:myelin protein zero-like protein 1 isoform X2 [Sceloporus undulatus]|uniref:myelin protein zero-like protein 1 isoform X2 n=1 Tax=Sceloporus undulatus TaxID=8520 RepID=UPI001C4D97DA|nr:myelin protein zero-like protein 1 isoform X2 [Sceloporus undulatus]